MNATRTILIAGQNTDPMNALGRLLGRMKWQILTTSNFQQGFDLVQRQDVSLVIAEPRDVEGRKCVAFLEQVTEMENWQKPAEGFRKV